MLFPTLLFPLEQVMGSVNIIISRDGVGEEGTVRTMGETVVSLLSSFSLRFFVSTAIWDKGSFFIPLTRAYLSLLYLVAISTKKKSERDVRNRNRKKKGIKKGRYTYFSLLGVFFLTRIQKARVQDSGHTNDKDLPNPQSHQSHEQIPK